MILVIGLGNPEKKYEKTRHNIGFMVMDSIAEELKVDYKFSDKFNSEIAEATVTFPNQKKHVRTLLVKPQTYMNKSGDAVSKLVNFYKVRTDDQVFIIHDDLDIEIGTIRIRLNGSSAGQKGIQSIIDRLGTDKFTRFRIGIKPKTGQTRPAEDFVLEKFKPNEQEIIKEEIEKAANLLIDTLDKGVIQTSI